MRFNGKELAAVAAQPSHKFDKEGVLKIKEKQDGLFRRNDVYTSRFCRLRGNLLFYFKNTDLCSEPIGVFVLERCAVILDDENVEFPFSFSLIFDGDKTVQKFAATNESERDSWIQVMHMASYQFIRNQLKTLREKLSVIEPLVELREDKMRHSRTKSILDSSDESFLEISLSCDNLICDGNGTAPNPMFIVAVMTPPETQWRLYFQSEIIERSSNPCFLTAVGFCKKDNVTPFTQVKIAVYDVRERLTLTTTLLGFTIFTLCQVMKAEKNKLRLTLMSADNNTVGFVSITAWKVESDLLSVTNTSNKCSSQEGAIGEKQVKSQTLPTKLPCKFRLSQHTQLNILYDNIISQTYRFHTGLGADLSVLEIMAENKLSFIFPQSLLLLYIKEEKDLLSNFTSLGELKPLWNQRQIEEIERHLQMIDSYTQSLTFLDSYTGPSFRPSREKCNKDFEFVPLNLHLQRLWVQNDSTKRRGFYDVITVGAFAAHTLKFKNGGLLKLLNKSNSKSNCKVHPNKLLEATTIFDKIQNLRLQIKSLLNRITCLAQRKMSNEMQIVMADIANLAKQISELCDLNLIEEAYHILEDARLPEYNKKCQEIGVRSSPLMISTRRSLEKDNENLSDVKNTRRIHHKRSSSDVRLYSDTIKSNSLDHPSSLNSKTSEDGLNRTTATLPNYNKRFGWPQNKEREMSTLIPEKRLGFVESSSLSNLFRKRPSQSTAEQSVVNAGKPDLKMIRNQMNSTLSKYKTSSLRSLNGTKYRCRSPDELEPWDLTQLNIEASIMCMISKVKTLGRVDFSDAVDDRENLTRLDWVEQLIPPMKKLTQALDCLYKSSQFMHCIFSLQETSDVVAAQMDIRYRRDIVNSYALTTIVTSLMTKLWCSQPDPMFLSRLCKIGILAYFEGLLSCYGDEIGMLEDMIIAIEDLKNVKFRLVKCENLTEIYPQVDGTRMNLLVQLPVPDLVYILLPMDYEKYEFVLTPIFLNVGINEQATLAEKFDNVTIQDKINLKGIEHLHEFYKKYKAFTLTSGNTKNSPKPNYYTIETQLDVLNTLVKSRKSKNVEILHVAAKVCRDLEGLRFTSCKSAKDRSSMSVTLEQCMVLEREFDLAEHEFNQALECMRYEGTRRENTFKNTGIMKYAFNSLRLMSFPKQYRPPPGTYGNVQT